MKKETIKSMGWLFAASLIICFSACKKKKDTTTPTPADPVKTLNKTTLTNNITWYNQGSTIIHPFKSNGNYGGSGSWNWVKTSDTMEIIMISGDPKLKWKFYYNTDTEMKCRWINNEQDIIFKTSPW